MADNTDKMLRMIINGQSAMKSELLGEIRRLDKKIDNLEDKMLKRMDTGFNSVNIRIDKLTKRVDKIGLAVARLEDDTPTIEEFEKLEIRVKKLEQTASLT